MEKYALNSKMIYEILKKKGVANLHHANTLATSLTFIRQNALLSRGYVEAKKLIQSKQKTDELDKQFNVWDDLFLDGTDLHYKYSKPNVYGPVMFVIPIDILQYPDFSEVFITKQNPYYWRSNQIMDDWYYSNTKDFEKDYLTGDKLCDGRICFTFKNKEAKLTLKKYCSKIVVDDPGRKVKIEEKEIPIIDRVMDKINLAITSSNLTRIPIVNRHNGTDFFCCGINYRFMKDDELRKMFGS